MNLRAFLSFQFAALALTASLLPARPALAARGGASGCSVGGLTELASSCAIGWDNQNRGAQASSFNPWPSFCEDENRQQRAMPDYGRRRKVNRSNCPGKLKVVGIDPANHMAEVHCMAPGPMGSARLMVNLDALECSPDNTRDQAGFRAGLKPRESCDERELPLSDQQLEFSRSQVKDTLSPFQKKMYDSLKEEIKGTQARVSADMSVIAERYAPGNNAKYLSGADSSRPGDGDVAVAIRNSRDELARYRAAAFKAYGPDCDREPPAPNPTALIQGQRTCRLLDVSVKKAEELLALPDHGALMGELGGYFQSHSADADFLAMRMVLFYGLTENTRKSLVVTGKERVKMVRVSHPTEIPAHGAYRGRGFYELHDGYVFGGSRYGNNGNGQDCSTFSMTAAMAVGGIEAPSTGVLRDIALKLAANGGVYPGTKPGIEHCFDVVELRKGAEPRAMDLVISRTEKPHPSQGHVVVVESYDSKTGEIVDLEAKGGKTNTQTRCVRPLFEPACASAPSSELGPVLDPPPVRPDIHVLRFKDRSPLGPAGQPLCPLKLQ